MIRIFDYCIKYSDIHYIRYYEHVCSLRIYFYDGSHIELSHISKQAYVDICKCLITYKEV